MNNTDMEALLRKFVEDKVSDVELELLQDFLKTKEGLECLDHIMNDYAEVFDTSQLLYPPRAHSARFVQSKAFRYTAIAASVLFVAISIYFSASYLWRYETLETAAGETIEITLPDNTNVTLNAMSKLIFPRKWDSNKERTVTLEGEGYFEVTHDPDHPFIVNAQGFQLKVLGTTFNVKSYKADSIIEATLVEGSVLFERTIDNTTLVMKPNQKVSYNTADNKLLLSDVQPGLATSWTKGLLVFQDKPFEDIRKDLQRRYGVNITVQNKPSLNCRFNATIEKETLEEVLNLFSASSDMTYQIKGDKEVIIKGNLCEQGS